MTTRKALLIKKYGSPKRKKRQSYDYNSENEIDYYRKHDDKSGAETVFMIEFFEVFYPDDRTKRNAFMTKLESLPRSLSNLVR